MTVGPSLVYKSRKLHLLRHNLAAIASTEKTPVYVYSRERIGQRLEQLRNSFTLPVHIHFAVKANSNEHILKYLRKKKTGVDVVSGGEIQRALKCGFSPRDIVFSGIGKSEDEISLALKAGVFLLNVESPEELERIGKWARRLRKSVQVSFRLNPDVDPKTHPYITTGFRNNKFGMDAAFLPTLKRILRNFKKEIALKGVAFHIGSQLSQVGPFTSAIAKSTPIYSALKSQGFPLEFFDVGGGLGVQYKDEPPFNISRYAKDVEKLLRPLGCEIILEPGRFLVADAGVLLTRVEYVKQTPYKNFVIVDTGMHHLLRPSLYDAFHRVLPVLKKAGKFIKADFVGPVCESSDWIAKDRKINLPKQGDLFAVCDVGAYGYVMASNYNLKPLPRELVL